MPDEPPTYLLGTCILIVCCVSRKFVVVYRCHITAGSVIGEIVNLFRSVWSTQEGGGEVFTILLIRCFYTNTQLVR